MNKRVINFNAGPAPLPEEALKRAEKDFLNFKGMGASLIELSHRASPYAEIHQKTIALFRKLLKVPESHHVLLLGGGATLQFGMVPLNLLRKGKSADYVVSGVWAKKASEDAAKISNIRIPFDGAEENYTSLPEDVVVDPNTEYLHITSNETIDGVQWKRWPESPVPLVCDMSSDIMSRPIPWENFGVVYAGAQKNLGPSGITVVVIRNDLAERSSDHLPAYLDYRRHIKGESLYNTPPVFSIYLMGLVLEWVMEQGGVTEMETRNRNKAALLYQYLDQSNGFYKVPAQKDYRSAMNIVFTPGNGDFEKTLLKEAAEAGMLGLKGHRSRGGLRASLYNAVPMENVEMLVDFLSSFQRKHGG